VGSELELRRRIVLHHQIQESDAMANELILHAPKNAALVKRAKLIMVAALVLFAGKGFAQEPVVGVTDPESLFRDKNPKLNANKQATLHIMKDLLQCNHWNEADKWLTARYVQHNPNVASGREGVVKFFGTRPRAATCDKLNTKIVAVLADGDLVTVVIPRELKDPKDPSKTYTTTWFDMWRFVDGKADEHWDPAVRPTP
jgi:predicted SnoaL-like aldol condensation-catalyzing enzyme